MKPVIDDPIKYARETVGGDPLSKFLGIKIEEVREGYARVSLEVKPEYMNAVERAHGGIVYMVLDQAFAVGSNSRGVSAVALAVTVNYLSGAPAGSTIVAEATPIETKRKVSVWKLEARTREDGKIVATATGTAYHQG
ncbi:MAG TPA: hotdog fold thioesterase [bacterium]|nr:hotdog fold thioesterase [bacterium]